MEQYHPRAHVERMSRSTLGRRRDVADETAKPDGRTVEVNAKQEVRYEDINRPMGVVDIANVCEAAEEDGLWRIACAAEHGGYNI